MPTHTIFYSWQSDIHNSINRGFIESALKTAVRAIRQDDTLTIEPVIDRDTAGLPGSPDIASAIFAKIEQADIFVCDVSIINPRSKFRPTPNPNVMIELGYALKILEIEQIIMVVNTASGAEDKLPFDIRGKRLIKYHLPKASEEKATERKDLARRFEDALRTILNEKDETRKQIKRAFMNESRRARQIALEQPEFWEFLLTAELIESKMLRVLHEFTEVSNDLTFRRTNSMTGKTFIDWSAERMEDISRLLTVLDSILTKLLGPASGEVGKSGDALAIQRAVNKIIAIGDNLIEWEAEARAIAPPPSFVQSKKLLEGWTEKIINEIARIPEVIRATLQEPNSSGTYIFRLKIEASQNADLLMAELQRLIANRGEWIDEY